MTGLLGRMQQNKPETEGQPAKPGPARPITQQAAQDTLPGTHILRSDERVRDLKQRIQRRMLAELKPLARKGKDKAKDQEKPEEKKPQPKTQLGKIKKEDKPIQDTEEEMFKRVRDLFDQIVAEEGIVLNRAERKAIFDAVVADIMGFGPLEPILADDATTDIMVIGPKKVYVERKGHIYKTSVAFEDDEHLLHIIERILSPLGRRVDETSPMVDARLPDGSRVNVVIPPVSLEGPCLTIRKFSSTPLSAADLIANNTASPEVFEFLQAAVKAQLNILISGGSGCGKTTLLNVMSGFIPDKERIVTIENAAELQLQQTHVIRLETRPMNIEGEGEITIRELVANSLRMRPDRIIVGEVRGSEAIDVLQAMNSGRDGSMGTIHANTPSDALSRLETMCLMGGLKLPVAAIREQVASAIDLIVQMKRFRDGSRKIVQVAEVEGMENDAIMLSTIFEYEQSGATGPQGTTLGVIKPVGLAPRCLDRIQSAGIHLSMSIFGVAGTIQTAKRPMKEFRTAEPKPTSTPPAPAEKLSGPPEPSSAP